MWYLFLPVGVYLGVYTASYGVCEWKNSNKPGAVLVWVLSILSVLIPAVNIFRI